MKSPRRNSERGLGDRSKAVKRMYSSFRGMDSDGPNEESAPEDTKPAKAKTPPATQKVAGARRPAPAARKATGGDSNRGKDGQNSKSRYPARDRRSATGAPQGSVKKEGRKAISRRNSSSAPSAIPDSVNQIGAFNRYLETIPHFRLLHNLYMGRWGKKYFKRKEEDQDMNIVDYGLDVEVRDRTSEGYPVWDKYTRSLGKTSGYVIDYIVATGERKLGEVMAVDLLVKFTNYPVPSWVLSSSITDNMRAMDCATRDCHIRCHYLDFIEIRLRLHFGDKKFEELFPNRYLTKEIGVGEGGYVTHRRAHYVNRYRSIESRWNYENDKAGLPPIYIEDWTDDPEADGELSLLKFTNYLINNKFVNGMLGRIGNQLGKMKCDADCSTCTCGTRSGKAKHCCGMKISIEINEKTGKFEWRDAGVASELAYAMNFECTDDCGCDKNVCRNRFVQTGRQVPLCIFREPGKGWGVRIMQELDNCKFVTEYIGEVRENATEGALSIYDFDMGNHARDRTGKRLYHKLLIAAGSVGNEARFFNHSCSPNMQTMSAVVERYGIFYHHLVFFTTRRVMPGEELTFDYFPDKTAADIKIGKMFPFCRCRSSKCRFPEGSCSVGEEDEEEEEKKSLMNPGDSDQERDEGMGATMGDGNDGEMDRTLVQSPPTRRRSSRLSLIAGPSISAAGAAKKGVVKREEDSDEEREVIRRKREERELLEEREKKNEVVKRRRSGKASPANEPKKRKPSSFTESDDEEDRKKEEERRKMPLQAARKRVGTVAQINGEGGLAARNEEDRDTGPRRSARHHSNAGSLHLSLPGASSTTTTTEEDDTASIRRALRSAQPSSSK